MMMRIFFSVLYMILVHVVSHTYIKLYLELGETGGVPYLILAPVLSHATPDQLYQIENHNFYLIEDTGPLWEYHSKKEFRNTAPDKNETWRNFYIVIDNA